MAAFNKTRVEAFSDGVIAILITIMVLELRVPHEPTIAALALLLPVLLSYVLSFIYLGIYWNNHHHMLQATGTVSGLVLWANMHLLFWLSLVPFVTGWMGESKLAPGPTALYGTVMLGAGTAFFILLRCILRSEGPDSSLARAVGRDFKGKISPVVYLFAIVAVFLNPWISVVLYTSVAMMWLVPDRRFERALQEEHSK